MTHDTRFSSLRQQKKRDMPLVALFILFPL